MSSRRVVSTVAVAVALLAAACGNGSATANGSRARASVTSPRSALRPGPEPGAASAHGAPTAGAAPSTTVGSVTPGSYPTGGRRASTPQSAAGQGGGPAAESVPGPQAARPGTYTYRQRGSSTFGSSTQSEPPQGTMVVEAPTNDGANQTWERYGDVHQPPDDTTLSFGSSGVFITSEVERVDLEGKATTITCTFPARGVPAPPWPPAVGKSFDVTGNCGSFTATVTGHITGQTTDQVGGTTVPVYVLQSNLVTHGAMQLTATETDWIASGFRLPLHTQTQSHGTYGFASFSSDTTADLESMTPT